MPFNPYHKWLGIPAKEQPPSHYRLLGVSPSESDGDVISASADQRMNYLYQFTKGEHAADAQRVMDEIARASMCLLDPIQRKAYDASLRAKSQFHSAPTAMISKPATTPIAIDEADTSYKPRGKDRSVLYFWLWNLTLLIAVVVLGVIIIIRRQQANEPGNAPDDAAIAAGDTDGDLTDGSNPDGGSILGPSTNVDTNQPSTPDNDTNTAGNVATNGGNSGNRTGGNTPRTLGPGRMSPTQPQPPNDPDDDPPTTVVDLPPKPPAEMASPPQAQPPVTLTYPSDTVTVQQAQAEWAEFMEWSVEHENSIAMPMVFIPPGEFEMGGWTGNDRTAQTQQVLISHPFALSRHEVTQFEWRRVMGDDAEPSYYSFTGEGSSAVRGLGTNHFPMESITWFEALQFCNALSRMESLEEYYVLEFDSGPNGPVAVSATIAGGQGYRLPTEAEWEFACKAGSDAAFDFGEVDIANADALNSSLAGIARTCEVESFAPNAFGIHDLHGNVWEWCFDWFDQFPLPADAPIVDPTGPEASLYSARLIRGGSHVSEPTRSTSTSRGFAEPGVSRSDIGLRVARTIGDTAVLMTSPTGGDAAEAIDLLALVNLATDADSAAWQKTAEGIMGDNTDRESFLTLPYDVPANYDLHIVLMLSDEARARDNDAHFLLPVGDEQIPFVVRRGNGVTAFSCWPADGGNAQLGLPPFGTAITRGDPFQSQRKLTFQVREGSISVLVDDNLQCVIDQLDQVRVEADPTRQIRLGSWHNQVLFRSVTLTSQ